MGFKIGSPDRVGRLVGSVDGSGFEEGKVLPDEGVHLVNYVQQGVSATDAINIPATLTMAQR